MNDDYLNIPVKCKINVNNLTIIVYDTMSLSNIYCYDNNGLQLWRVGDYHEKELLFLYACYSKPRKCVVAFDAHGRRFDVNLKDGSLNNMNYDSSLE